MLGNIALNARGNLGEFFFPATMGFAYGITAHIVERGEE